MSRKVAADMFGLALRTYQTKMQRLARSSTERDRTLWEGLLAFVEEEGPVSRKKLLDRAAAEWRPGEAAQGRR